jgi:hypothetical protein
MGSDSAKILAAERFPIDPRRNARRRIRPGAASQRLPRALEPAGGEGRNRA